MPLLNDIPAAGLTPLQLQGSITEKLKKYIADPRVTVVVTAMNSRRIFVTGEVTHTGPMPLLPHMTMLQALSQAGFTQFANLKAIYLLRTENGRQQKLPFNYKEVVTLRSRARENRFCAGAARAVMQGNGKENLAATHYDAVPSRRVTQSRPL